MANVEMIEKTAPYPEQTGKFKINPKEVGRIKARIKQLEGRMADAEVYRQLTHEGFWLHNIREALRQSNRALIGEQGSVPIIAKKVNSQIEKPKRVSLFAGLKKFRIHIPRI